MAEPEKPSAPNDIHPQLPENDAPDGGVVAWLVILGVWCCSFCSFGWVNSVGVFQEYYQNKLLYGYSSSTIAWIPSLQIFFVMSSGPFVGIIYDRYGSHWLLLIGSFMHVFGVLMTSFGTAYYQILLAQGLCSAMGCSMLFQPCMHPTSNLSQSTDHHSHHGRSEMVSSQKRCCHGNRIHGVQLRRRGLSNHGVSSHTRSRLRLGNAHLRVPHPLSPRPRQPDGASLEATPPAQSHRRRALPSISGDRVPACLGWVFCFCFGYFVPLNYFPMQALSVGMSASLQQYLVPVLNAASLFGRLMAGFVGDKVGQFNVFIIVCYLSSIWILALWLLDSSDAALVAFAVLFEFFSGAFISLATPLIAQVPRMPELGFRVGMVLFAGGIAGLTTNPINGAIVDGQGGWKAVKIFSGVSCLLGTTLVLLVRIRKAGMKLCERI